MLEVGGLGACGDVMAAGGSSDGDVRNLDLFAGTVGSVGGEFDHEGDGTEPLRFVVYLDGQPQSECSPDDQFETDPLEDGDHTVDVAILRASCDGTPDLAGDGAQNRARVAWAAVTAADLASYQVWGNEGSGAVDTLLDTVSVIDVGILMRATPTSGTGTGTLSTSGTYAGSAMNAACNVRVATVGGDSGELGTVEVDPGTGSYGTAQTVWYGLPIDAGNGVMISLDASTGYDVGDVWTFRVGPRCWWISEALAAGTYKYAIKAVDAAGNASALSSEVSIVVPAMLAAPTAVEATYDTPDVTLTWTDAPGATGVRIYSNWDSVFSTLRDYVLEDGPIATVAAGVETATIETGDAGEVLFYVRSYDASGTEDNATLIRVDCVASPWSDLGDPFALSATPAAGGAITLQWSTDLREGTPSDFAIFQFDADPTAAEFDAATPLDTVGADLDTDVVGDIATQTWTSGALSGTKWFGVRALDADGYESETYATTSATADSTAPSAPDGVIGGRV